MDSELILRQLCERLGLPTDHGARLQPLVERALQAPPDVKDRILALVARRLEREAAGRRRGAVSPAEARADDAVLAVIARILHPWSPPDWLLRLDSQPPGDSSAA